MDVRCVLLKGKKESYQLITNHCPSSRMISMYLLMAFKSSSSVVARLLNSLHLFLNNQWGRLQHPTSTSETVMTGQLSELKLGRSSTLLVISDN